MGTELLLGQIVNSNAASIGATLTERGHDAHFQQVVGDNTDRIAQAVRLATSRADGVVITGGIGPTQDDVTREGLCAATGRDMVMNHDYADHLRRLWKARGRAMPESNLRQAQHPEGAELLDNPKGTAPGLALEHEGKLIFCLPGVPEEMEYLLHASVIPRLDVSGGPEQAIISRIVRTWGRPESDVAGLLDDLYASTNPSIAFLASAGEIKIRVTAKAESTQVARSLIEPLEDEIVARLGESVFGFDDETIEQVLLTLLIDGQLTIGTAESMTGGLVAARLTQPPGASAVMRGGLVAYHPDLKATLLGVTDTTRLVDTSTAEEMAAGARSLLGVDVAVAVTGSAGPEALELAPGTVVIGVATPERVGSRQIWLPGDRERVRAYGATAALHLTRLALIGKWWTG